MHTHTHKTIESFSSFRQLICILTHTQNLKPSSFLFVFFPASLSSTLIASGKSAVEGTLHKVRGGLLQWDQLNYQHMGSRLLQSPKVKLNDAHEHHPLLHVVGGGRSRASVCVREKQRVKFSHLKNFSPKQLAHNRHIRRKNNNTLERLGFV